VLQTEFSADEGSFLLQLRGDLVWNKTSFTRLTNAMLACCRAYDKGDLRFTMVDVTYYTAQVPRWLAEGFWTVGTFVKGHTEHPAWDTKRAAEPEYYDAAYWRLHMLGEWFFTGQCPYKDPAVGFAPM
jgi:hypothetical protein